MTHMSCLGYDWPMAPVLKSRLTLRSGHGSHWLTFDIRGEYGYVAPEKNSDDGTEIFSVATHTSIGVIGASEDMLEVDFANGRISQVGDQYGIGDVEPDRPRTPISARPSQCDG